MAAPRQLALALAALLAALPAGGCTCAPPAGVGVSSRPASAASAARGSAGSTRAKAPPPPRALRFVTYNVLADAVHVAERMPVLLELLRRSRGDVIALQEVAPWFLQRLRAAPWSKRYGFSGRFAPGGQLILSTLPIRRAFFRLHPGRQRRTAVVVVLALPGGGELAVATSHMESPLADGPTRARQLDQLFKLLRPYRHAVLLGDFNFGDGEQPETAHLDKRYVDLWTALRGSAAGLTWNREKSPMADKGSFAGEKSRRLDRIVFRGPGFRARSIAIIGDKPVSKATPAIFPSDHFGLAGVLRFDPKRARASSSGSRSSAPSPRR